MTTTTPLVELWHAAGRAARDDRKRLVALYGVLLTPPVLVLGAVIDRLGHLAGIDASDLRRPLSFVVSPLVDAWRSDADFDLLAYLLLQLILMSLLWGAFGGVIYRMAAVHISTGRKEEAKAATSFARRHWRAFAGASAVLWLGVLVPAALAVVVASAAKLPGIFGLALEAPAVIVAAALAFAAVVAASVVAVGGFLSGPTVACEDSDAFDAVSRVFEYSAAGLPRLVAVKAAFFGGVLLGSGWRALRTAGALLVGALLFRAGAGADAWRRAIAVLDAMGRPADADRLGITLGDVAAAAAMAAVAGALIALWLADLVSRVLCARVGAYLAIREAVDRVPAATLRTAPTAAGRIDAESAGFVEVSRIEPSPPARRP